MDTDREPTVWLILAAQTWGSVLHAARSLHGRGAEVHVAVFGGGAEVYRASRAVASAHDVQEHDGEYPGDALLGLIEEKLPSGRIAVLPTSDAGLALLDSVRPRLPQRIVAIAPRSEVVEALLHKDRAAKLAEAAGIAVAPWTVVAGPGDLEAAEGLRLPVILRPTAHDRVGSKPFKLRVVRTPGHLEAALSEAIDAGATVIAQEYLDVEDHAVEFALTWTSADGERTEMITGRKRRQAGPDGGVMVWGETTEAPDVAEAARGFIETSGFTGVGGLEVIRDRGELWFVEWNPRLEAIHFLATAAGVDLIGLLHAEATGSEPPATDTVEPAAAWLGGPFLELLGHRQGRRQALADRFAFQRSPKRVRSIWSRNDPKPAVVLGRHLVRAALGRRGAS